MMSIKDGDRLPNRRILIYFNFKISQSILTVFIWIGYHIVNTIIIMV